MIQIRGSSLIFLSVFAETFTAADMPGFGVLLAALALLSTGRRSSAAGLEVQNPAAVERGSLAPVKSSAVPAVDRTTAGVKSSVTDVGSTGDGNKGAERFGCPGRCRCEVDGLLHRVDCSDLGLREIPSNLSVFTSYL